MNDRPASPAPASAISAEFGLSNRGWAAGLEWPNVHFEVAFAADVHGKCFAFQQQAITAAISHVGIHCFRFEMVLHDSADHLRALTMLDSSGFWRHFVFSKLMIQ